MVLRKEYVPMTININKKSLKKKRIDRKLSDNYILKIVTFSKKLRLETQLGRTKQNIWSFELNLLKCHLK